MDPTRSMIHHHSSGGGGREECWSEGATETLIEAWGDRYVNLNRGNLRQKDWKQVADAVNSRQNGEKPKKTDTQCKNRIDTLKRKYKTERAKSPPSKWPFYNRLESLIGAITKKKEEAMTKTTSFKDDDHDESGFDERWRKKEQRVEDVEWSDGGACRELGRAILRFGEIYERIESCKQQQIMELEKLRMEFTKQIEFQRLNLFLDLHKKAVTFASSSNSGKKL